MIRWRVHGLLVLGAWSATGAAGAQPPVEPPAATEPAPPLTATAYPTIVEIAFAGNDTTRPATMLREMVVHVGDPADPAKVERSRQGVQDLGLFRSVTVEPQPVEGGVRLLFTVKEKYYIIPAPRADANSDGKYAYGVQLRWYNVLGLNHEAKLTLKEQNNQDAGRGLSLMFDGSYTAPFLFDSPYGLDLSYSHAAQPVDADPAAVPPTPAYEQVQESARAIVSRTFADKDGPASVGWRFGTGVQWLNVRNEGEGSPPAAGMSSALVVNGSYNGMHYNVYSDAGQSGSFEVAGATQRFLSDYAYSSVTAHYDGSWYVGSTPHQSVALFAEGGVYHGVPSPDGGHFALGGAEDLRGYRHNFLHGDTYYYAGVEALRPLYWQWLRGVVFFEGGNTFREDGQFTVDGSYMDIGAGLRLRIPLFVHFELNVGYAWPLKDPGDGTKGRLFATGRR